MKHVLDILTFVQENSKEYLDQNIEDIHPYDFLEALEQFEGDRNELFDKLPDHYVALLIDQAENEDKFNLLSLFPDYRKENIISEMSSDEIADMMGSIDVDEQAELLMHMDDEVAEEVTELMGYRDDCAGGIMATEFLAIYENMSIAQTLELLRREAPNSETPYYLYVTDEYDVLKGVVPLRNIIISEPSTLIKDIMIENIISIPVDMDQEDVANMFDKYGFMAIPVVDIGGVILGIVTFDDVLGIIKEEHTEDMYRLAGLGEGEKLSGSVNNSIKSRLPWLLVNLVTAILAAATVSLFEHTIARIVALATFMPIVAGMGGNAGTQTLTMIIRGLALGELSFENEKDVLRKELLIGLFNGLALGLVVGTLGFLWEKSLVFGLVIGVAMFLTLLVANISGYFVPLILKKLGIDPALASAVFVTTVTDVLGFAFFLGFATIMVNLLV